MEKTKNQILVTLREVLLIHPYHLFLLKQNY